MAELVLKRIRHSRETVDVMLSRLDRTTVQHLVAEVCLSFDFDSALVEYMLQRVQAALPAPSEAAAEASEAKLPPGTPGDLERISTGGGRKALTLTLTLTPIASRQGGVAKPRVSGSGRSPLCVDSSPTIRIRTGGAE